MTLAFGAALVALTLCVIALLPCKHLLKVRTRHGSKVCVQCGQVFSRERVVT